MLTEKHIYETDYRLTIDQLGGIPFEGDDYYNEYGCISNIEPGKLLEQINNRLNHNALSLDDKRVLISLKNSISEDDNDYVFIGKLKK